MHMPLAQEDTATRVPENVLVDRFGIGGNEPPDELEVLRDSLSESADDLVTRRRGIEKNAELIPARIEDEATAAKVIDLLDIITKCNKQAETLHKAKKAPFLEGGRVVDRFFSAELFDPFAALKKKIDPLRVDWLSRKAAEEKRRRDEAALLAKEAADLLAKEAQKAAAEMQDAEALDGAIAAEEAAALAAAIANKATQEAEASLADLSRARGNLGAATSLRKRWVGSVSDLSALDLDALRQHLPADALQQAINSFIRANGRSLRGADIREIAY